MSLYQSYIVERPVDALVGDAVAHLDRVGAVLAPEPAAGRVGVGQVAAGGLHHAPVPRQVPALLCGQGGNSMGM